MIHAYNELYLSDAQTNLANAIDYALNDCGFTAEKFSSAFVQSRIAKQFETGNPAIIYGMSGQELVAEIVSRLMPGEKLPNPRFSQDRSPEYWAGWALAYYQWYTAKRFKDIFIRIPLSEIIGMYQVFHEMDLSNFVESMEKRYNSIELETKLKSIRESRQLTQDELAKLSGVSKRMIQLYEQKANDIDKAQAQTLYKLSRTLGCSIEDLLENPEEMKK